MLSVGLIEPQFRSSLMIRRAAALRGEGTGCVSEVSRREARLQQRRNVRFPPHSANQLLMCCSHLKSTGHRRRLFSPQELLSVRVCRLSCALRERVCVSVRVREYHNGRSHGFWEAVVQKEDYCEYRLWFLIDSVQRGESTCCARCSLVKGTVGAAIRPSAV